MWCELTLLYMEGNELEVKTVMMLLPSLLSTIDSIYTHTHTLTPAAAFRVHTCSVQISSKISQLMPGHFETTQRVCNGSLWAIWSEKNNSNSVPVRSNETATITTSYEFLTAVPWHNAATFTMTTSIKAPHLNIVQLMCHSSLDLLLWLMAI